MNMVQNASATAEAEADPGVGSAKSGDDVPAAGARLIYVVEHMEDDVFDWVRNEYARIVNDVVLEMAQRALASSEPQPGLQHSGCLRNATSKRLTTMDT